MVLYCGIGGDYCVPAPVSLRIKAVLSRDFANFVCYLKFSVMVDYLKNIGELVELKNKAMSRRHDWLKGLILLASTLFGVLVSFRSTSPHEANSALLLALAISLLGLGILCLGIALYEQVYLTSRMPQDYHAELQSAVENRRSMNMVTVTSPRFFAICRAISYILFALSLLLMCVYTIVISL